MTTPGRRLAVNPIPYWAKAGKTREVFEEAFADFAKIGYSAVKADVPEGMEAQEYLDWIGSYGLAPAISLFSSPFDETIDVTEEAERAKRFAGTQVALGLDRTMISSMAIPARMVQPAVGADFNRDRLNLAIENCGIICQVLHSEGLRPLHHSHVGGVFETEDEIVTLLDELGPDLIGFGPDTGHLRWAGIEPASLIERYADRLGGIHIKDVFPDHLGPRDGTGEAPGGASYQELAATKRSVVRARPGSRRLRGYAQGATRGLRRRLHDRDRRTQRRLAIRVSPDRLRVGATAPSGESRLTYAAC